MGAYGDYKKRLVKELKKRIVAAGGDGVSVRGGRGTAWGWIDVWCSPGAEASRPSNGRLLNPLSVGLQGVTARSAN